MKSNEYNKKFISSSNTYARKCIKIIGNRKVYVTRNPKDKYYKYYQNQILTIPHTFYFHVALQKIIRKEIRIKNVKIIPVVITINMFIYKKFIEDLTKFELEIDYTKTIRTLDIRQMKY